MFKKFFEDKNNLILIFTIIYLSIFTVSAILGENFEFLYYTVLMVFLIFLVLHINKFLHLSFFIVFNLSILGFLHLFAGNFYIDDLRLYDFYLIPGIFRYDNFIHIYGTFIGTLALYSLLVDFIGRKIQRNHWIFSLILILMGMGLGVIVELVELGAVLFLDASEQVGDYYNNAFDLFFNTIGAILAAVIIYFYREHPRYMKKINEMFKKDN